MLCTYPSLIILPARSCSVQALCPFGGSLHLRATRWASTRPSKVFYLNAVCFCCVNNLGETLLHKAFAQAFYSANHDFVVKRNLLSPNPSLFHQRQVNISPFHSLRLFLATADKMLQLLLLLLCQRNNVLLYYKYSFPHSYTYHLTRKHYLKKNRSKSGLQKGGSMTLPRVCVFLEDVVHCSCIFEWQHPKRHLIKKHVDFLTFQTICPTIGVHHTKTAGASLLAELLL